MPKAFERKTAPKNRKRTAEEMETVVCALDCCKKGPEKLTDQLDHETGKVVKIMLPTRQIFQRPIYNRLPGPPQEYCSTACATHARVKRHRAIKAKDQLGRQVDNEKQRLARLSVEERMIEKERAPWV